MGTGPVANPPQTECLQSPPTKKTRSHLQQLAWVHTVTLVLNHASARIVFLYFLPVSVGGKIIIGTIGT
jgi:hypothetical protein